MTSANTISKKIRQLSEGEKKRIKEAFDLLDTDNDGYIDYHEMKAATRALGLEAKKAQILSIMRTYDPPDGNKICYEDFYYIISDKIAKRNQSDEFKYAFKLFTANSDSGKINLKNLQDINKRTNSGLTDDEMRSMIEEFDINFDGSIDEAEFMEIMMRYDMNSGVDWQAEHRRTLLDSRATLERSGASVVRSQRVAAETEQVGTEVIAELGEQRETLLRAKRRLSQTDQELTKTQKILQTMTRRVLTNKFILILIIILEVGILATVVYLKFFHK